jgi:hypothetical protein
MACDTVRFAVEHGADTLSLIRAYETPGAMQVLAREGFWSAPDVWRVYEAARWALDHTQAVTLVDAWSLGSGPLRPCCASPLLTAIGELNVQQTLPVVDCACRAVAGEILVRDVDDYRRFLSTSLEH